MNTTQRPIRTVYRAEETRFDPLGAKPWRAVVTANGYTETLKGYQYLPVGVRPGQTVVTISKYTDDYYTANTPQEGITLHLQDMKVPEPYIIEMQI